MYILVATITVCIITTKYLLETQMNVVHGLMSVRNIITVMIHCILESCQDQMKWLTENGNMLHFDEL